MVGSGIGCAAAWRPTSSSTNRPRESEPPWFGFSGVDEVVEAHRRIAQTGVRWEVVTLAEVDDLVTGFVRVGLPNAKRSLSAIVLSFDTAGLVADIYSHIAAPDTGPAEVDTMDGSTAPA
jgi:hypothetical protein